MPGYLFLTTDRRRAFTPFMASERPYAVQTWRAVERKFRECRFCCERTAVEDEEHVLFRCTAESLFLSRLRMRAQMSRYNRSAASENDHGKPWQFVADLCPVLAVNSDADWRDLAP